MNSNFISNFKTSLILIALLTISTTALFAQETYEIEVYSSPTTPKNTSIIELHSNTSPNGPKNETNFTHPLHETIEVTTGITDNFEVGVYFFNRMSNGAFNYMGSHIRPRVTIPKSWNWFMGASISVESGFIKDPFTNEFQLDYEIRPILDKTFGKNYISINPTLDGVLKTKEISFSPNVKYAYEINPKYALGVEYYGVTGNPFHWENLDIQTHQFFIVTYLTLNKKHEIEFGIGRGTTLSSDVWNIKLILGQRINWIKNKK